MKYANTLVFSFISLSPRKTATGDGGFLDILVFYFTFSDSH